ncbi:hypothetical protein, partial [Pseudomonas syringae group genomosp. 3]|uniref:hypothetical protein n=1 Tax=Pseudomonas syringae group genomosp. 3 TaxID=251701 RepID=UPI00289187CE
IKHQGYRGGRYVAALDNDGNRSGRLLYLARADTPETVRVPPPQVGSMYGPNWQALGDAPAQMVVKGKGSLTAWLVGWLV